MLRLIAKWYISRSIDCNRYLPAWVDRRIARDRQLKQFYDQSKRLAARLRSTEPEFVSSFGTVGGRDVELPRLSTARSTRSTALLGAFSVGLAAVVLFALAPFFHRSHKDNLSVPSENPLAHADTNSGSDPHEPIRIDPEQVRSMIASGRSLIQRLKPSPERTSEPVLNADLDQLAAFVNLDVKQAIEPVADLGTNYGVLLSKLDRHVESENRQLISGGVDAWKYFVRKLPQSAASLAGL